MDSIVYVAFTENVALLSISWIEISNQLSIEQYSSAIIVYHGWYERDWRHSETCPHYDDEIGNFQILPQKPSESVRQALSN